MQIIGHRGACGYSPENTLASFKKAVSLGVDMIELDVYALTSGEIVVIHDDTVDRTTNGSGPVADYSFADLRSLDAGNGEKIPLLTEVLDLLHRRIPINIELKGTGTALPVAQIIKQYMADKNWPAHLFVVSSLNSDELNQFAALHTGIRISALFDTQPVDFTVLDSSDAAFSLNLNAEHIKREDVEGAHKRGLKVFTYTVNTNATAKRMSDLCVDGIFTNYPDAFLDDQPQTQANQPHLAPSFDTA